MYLEKEVGWICFDWVGLRWLYLVHYLNTSHTLYFVSEVDSRNLLIIIVLYMNSAWIRILIPVVRLVLIYYLPKRFVTSFWLSQNTYNLHFKSILSKTIHIWHLQDFKKVLILLQPIKRAFCSYAKNAYMYLTGSYQFWLVMRSRQQWFSSATCRYCPSYAKKCV